MATSKKTLYHSELVKNGPTRVTVKTDLLKSKYNDKEYVALIIGNDERNYNPENQACAEFWRGQKGKTFTVVAEGREAEATLTYVGESGAAKPPTAAPPAQAAATAQQPARGAAPAGGAPAAGRGAAAPAGKKGDKVDKLIDGLAAAGKFGVALQLAARQCLAAAEGFCRDNGVALTPETRVGMVNNIAEALCQRETLLTVHIGLERSLAIGGLPSKLDAELLAAAKDRVAARMHAARPVDPALAKKAAEEAAAKAAAKAAEEAAALAAEAAAEAAEGADDVAF